jgi:regulator of cell morphogenesis and NO signaling
MTDLRNQTLAEIVTKDHRTASLFEKYHLDFCCKGKRTLNQACSDQNISTEELIKELTYVKSVHHVNDESQKFDSLSLTELAEYIVAAHHTYVKREMPPLLTYLQKITSKHGERHPELYKITALFTALKEEMEMHMQKEELILFPRIKETEKYATMQDGHLQFNLTYLRSPISVMEQEHDHAGSIMAEIRDLSNNYTPPADACTTYKLAYSTLEAFEKDLHQHVHLENNILFPKAISLFKNFNETILN